MLRRSNFLLILAVLLIGSPLAAPLAAQMTGMMPQMSGVWNPVVGTGASYELVDKNGQKTILTMAIVSKEDSNGVPGYWMEMLTTDKNGQQIVMQMLMVKDGGVVSIPKMIIQTGGRGPMEMSTSTIMAMGGRGGFTAPPTPKADFRESSERVGSESVTTPAGTFDTEHWRNKEKDGDVWFSPKVAPWGLIKTTSPNTSMTLIKVITDAKSHIIGTPMNMDDMMNGRGRGR